MTHDQVCIPKGEHVVKRPRSTVTIVAERDIMRSDMQRAFQPLLRKRGGLSS